MEVNDYAPQLTREEELKIFKPLTSLNQEEFIDQCNISGIRSIAKAINGNLIMKSGRKGRDF